MQKNFFHNLRSINLRRITLPTLANDLIQQVQQAQLLMVASSLAYTTILSIIPVLAVSFAIFQAFGGMQKLYDLVEPMILSNLAHGASSEAIAMLHKFIDNTHAGAVGVSGLVGLIFTSMSLMFSAEKAINFVWQTKPTRSVFQRVAAYWLFITLGPLALSVAVGTATSFNFPLAKLLPSGTGIFILTIGIFFCVFKWVPNTKVKPLFALISAAVTAAFWNIARVSYLLYTDHVVSYNKIYGSLGAIPILMLWIYILWIIVLSGAALTAALQKRSEGKSPLASESTRKQMVS
jgi:membrane protein